VLLTLAATAHAQLSLSSAVDIAVKRNPKVQMAYADVQKADAQLSQAHAAYIPQVTAGAGIGNSYGYSPNPPTLFAANAGSLVYNQSQFDYIRSAHAGVKAAQLAYDDAREAAAEDTALSYASLDHDMKREAAIRQQGGYADALVRIEQERADAGKDSAIDLTQAKLSRARLRQSLLHAQDTTAVDRDHLANLLGLAPGAVQVDGGFPDTPLPVFSASSSDGYVTPAVAAAFASAHAKQEMAFGDARYLYRPQFNLVVQYNRYATFTDSFKQLENLKNGNAIGANEGVFALQITIPFYDKVHQAKARESAADASHAYQEARNAQFLAVDGQSKLRHSIEELKANQEVAALEQQLSQQQLDILRVQLGGTTPDGPQMTPKDEQNALISEREKYLAVVDAAYQLRQAQISLLRQTGGLLPWLKSLPPAPVPTTTP
jgi:outer membrane protein TolC